MKMIVLMIGVKEASDGRGIVDNVASRDSERMRGNTHVISFADLFKYQESVCSSKLSIRSIRSPRQGLSVAGDGESYRCGTTGILARASSSVHLDEANESPRQRIVLIE